jgi:hypothetical protein
VEQEVRGVQGVKAQRETAKRNVDTATAALKNIPNSIDGLIGQMDISTIQNKIQVVEDQIKAEREKQAQIRSTPGYYDYTKDPVRCNKISEANKGRKGAAEGKTWFNNGDTETYCYLCPEGFVKGRKPRASTKQGLLWYNNGIVSKQFKLDTQPKGFIRGRITKK